MSFTADATLTEANLLRELRTVTEWFPLGLLLNVPRDALLAIRQQYSAEGLPRLKGEMISQYLNTGEASWKLIITALRDIGRNALAEHLEAKHIRQGEVIKCAMRCMTLMHSITSYSSKDSSRKRCVCRGRCFCHEKCSNDQ